MAKFSLNPFNQDDNSKINLASNVVFNDDELYISYHIDQNLELIDLGSYQPNHSRVLKLWERTCFEFFLKAPNGHYIEFNFAPNFAWNAFFFEVIRGPLKELESIKHIEMDILNSSDKFFLVAKIKRSELPIEFNQNLAQCTFGITSVIKLKNNETEYWALKHADSKPNFHVYDSFIGKF